MMVGRGSHLGPYEIREPLGAGGMGAVYRALDPRIGREVAIKILPAAFARDDNRLARFGQETRSIPDLSRREVAWLDPETLVFSASPFPFPRANDACRNRNITDVPGIDASLLMGIESHHPDIRLKRRVFCYEGFAALCQKEDLSNISPDTIYEGQPIGSWARRKRKGFAISNSTHFQNRNALSREKRTCCQGISRAGRRIMSGRLPL